MSIISTMAFATALLLFAGDSLGKRGCWQITILGVVELIAGLYFMTVLIGEAASC